MLIARGFGTSQPFPCIVVTIWCTVENTFVRVRLRLSVLLSVSWGEDAVSDILCWLAAEWVCGMSSNSQSGRCVLVPPTTVLNVGWRCTLFGNQGPTSYNHFGHSSIHSFLACITRSAYPQWTILSQINCFIYGEVMSCWIVFIHIVRECPGGLVLYTPRRKLFRSVLFHLAFVAVEPELVLCLCVVNSVQVGLCICVGVCMYLCVCLSE